MGSSRSDDVTRVTQLDAVDLDKEIAAVMKNQILTVTKFMKVGFLGRWEPEIEAALSYIIWKLSVEKNHTTFGMQLLGTRFAGQPNRQRLVMLAVLTIGSRYFKHRWPDISRQWKLGPQAQRAVDWIETTVLILQFLNLLLFLHQGRYPTLTSRLLGLHVEPVRVTRRVGYSFMVRELLWHSFSEILNLALPLINTITIRRWFNWLRRSRGTSGRYQQPIVNPVFTTTTRCAVCNEPPIQPQCIGCTHIFCYYCVQANVLADPQFECPLCGFCSDGTVRNVPL
ncbi:peroxisome biogenesis factor 2 [Schistocerca cancellata]|uniref:peroxisome biogenesis factor 2 n=1 Tax=Schistocerca cancellata TaxID=274614 RepID=UPI002117BF79|nr:peroxisome biogenesis factor 2 [Schistocerca cancellata]